MFRDFNSEDATIKERKEVISYESRQLPSEGDCVMAGGDAAGGSALLALFYFLAKDSYESVQLVKTTELCMCFVSFSACVFHIYTSMKSYLTKTIIKRLYNLI